MKTSAFEPWHWNWTWYYNHHYLHFHKAHATQNLTGWWLRIRGPHPQSHVTYYLCGHVTKKNVVSTFTRLMVPKTWQGPDSGWERPTQKVTWHFNPVLTWQIKNVTFSQAYGLKNWQDGYLVLAVVEHKAKLHFFSVVTLQRRNILTFTWPMVRGID